ncbi:GNAT family N-acetyltransferase [Serinicoccus kebangsaanensis]|uniref:GNAT family N-acetyltransferase n=1 Tax=Serinicoccus kebangsaanensis TaxID=2602069 RepID=UPI00124F15FB|nr:GNAT family N-acetyltransferase [Serinicoccus kebangsaanensis]
MAGHEILISDDDRPRRDELLALYDAVGWSAYTTDPETLEAAVAGSTRVVTARYGGELLGLARVVSDGASIAYLQDVLVRPELQREGVGRSLVHAALEPFSSCRQKVLLTDDEPRQRAFYESLGWTEIREHQDGRLRAFVQSG